MPKTYDDYLKSPEFKKARLMVQQGKQGNKAKAAYIALSVMNLDKHEDNSDLFPYIDDRELGAMLGVSHSTVSMQKKRLQEERWGIEKVVEKVDTSEMKFIGRGVEEIVKSIHST